MARGVTIPRVRALDGLRGAAVAGVLLFHGGHLTGGYLGVDLFFVLSGFLITSLLLAESGSQGSIRLGSFWARRARRLLPALAGLLVGVAVYCVVFADPGQLAQIRGDALATIGYVANWRDVFSSQDYFALFTAPSPLQHTWSLAIEEQFYLVWPLVFVGLLAWWKRSAPTAVFVVAVLGAVVSGALFMLLSRGTDVSRAYYGTDTRAAGVLLGAALAAALTIWGPVRGRRARAALEVAGGVAIVVLAFAWTRIDGQSPTLYRGGLLLCGVAVVVVIAAAAHPEAGPISKVLSWRPLCLLGLVSYGVYLWHWPVYVVLDPVRTGLDGWTLLGIRVGLTLVIAVISYRWLELPIRHGAGSPRQWQVILPVAAVVLVAVVFTSTLGARTAIPSASAVADPANVRDAVSRAEASPGSRRILVVGNSVGWFLGQALESMDPATAGVVLNQALPACVFPSGLTELRYRNNETSRRDIQGCDGAWRRQLDAFRPDTVLFVYGEPGDADYRYGGRWLRPCTRAYDDFYRRHLENSIRELGSTGAHVVVTTAAYASVAAAFPQISNGWLARTDCSNRVRRQAARATGAQLVDLFGHTCPDGRCRVREHGVVLRPDGIHYEGEGAELVAHWILDQLP